MEEAVEHAEWDVNNYISAQQARYDKSLFCGATVFNQVSLR
jgi:hypothetical protein